MIWSVGSLPPSVSLCRYGVWCGVSFVTDGRFSVYLTSTWLAASLAALPPEGMDGWKAFNVMCVWRVEGGGDGAT